MRKIAFIIVLTFVLSSASAVVFAGANPEYDKALKYYNSKNYKEAAKLLKEYVKKNPDPSAYYRLGYALYKLKKYDEANEYFKEAYLIDPMASTGEPGSYEKYKKAKIKEAEAPQAEQVPSAEKQPVPESKSKQPVTKQAETKQQPVSEKQASKETQVQKPEATAVSPQEPQEQAATPETKTAPPAAQKVEPPKPVMPPAGLPPMPMPKQEIPGMPGGLYALIAGFAMIFLIIGIAFYLFICFCLFRIAKKLNVPSPWIAFIPIVQVWTWVTCAGKPAWWIILLLVPIVNIFLGIYLWMCIAENLGKNKWLFGVVQGIFWYIFFPISLVLLAIMAFSKSEKEAGVVGVSEEI